MLRICNHAVKDRGFAGQSCSLNERTAECLHMNGVWSVLLGVVEDAFHFISNGRK